MNVNLHIERLILDGIPLARGQEPLLRAAVEAELARLISAGGPSPALMSGEAVPRLQAGDIRWSGEGGPRGLGREIARALYGGIGK